jgi:hypothetical protein
MTSQEQQVMDTFKQVSMVRGFEPAVFKERMRMAKCLLLSLRQVPYKQSHSYRQMVDRNLPLFNALGSQHTFLSVSREFYYFWRSDMLKTQSAKSPAMQGREMAIAA